MSKRLTRGQAIKAKCLDCSADSTTSVRCCQIIYCPLWLYRFGITPTLHKQGKSDYRVFIDRDFFEAHLDMPEEEFLQVLRSEAQERYKNAEIE